MLPKEKLTKTFKSILFFQTLKSKDWLERLVYSMLKRRKMKNVSTTFISYYRLYYICITDMRRIVETTAKVSNGQNPVSIQDILYLHYEYCLIGGGQP